jgi:hypothetical protein
MEWRRNQISFPVSRYSSCQCDNNSQITQRHWHVNGGSQVNLLGVYRARPAMIDIRARRLFGGCCCYFLKFKSNVWLTTHASQEITLKKVTNVCARVEQVTRPIHNNSLRTLFLLIPCLYSYSGENQVERETTSLDIIRAIKSGMLMDKVAFEQVFCMYFSFPCQFSFYQLLRIH